MGPGRATRLTISLSADHSVAVEKGGCFPGWSRVTVAGGFQKSLSSLTPGDRVMALSETGQVVFSPVLLFLHRDPESRWRFLSLQTEDGRRLAVTPHHLVFSDSHCGPDSSRYQAQFASRAQTGTCVLVHTRGGEVHPSRIVSITEEESVGAYAPLTEAGSVFVDGVLASSYALVEDHRLAHWAFGPVRLLSSVSQLLWAEPEERSEGSKTPPHPHALARDDRKVCARNSTSIGSEADPRGRTSEVHWYARLLHGLGWIVLNPDLFHS